MGKISQRNYDRALLCSLLFPAAGVIAARLVALVWHWGGAGAEAADMTSVMG